MTSEYRIEELKLATEKVAEIKEQLKAWAGKSVKFKRQQRRALEEDLLFWGNKVSYLEAAEVEMQASHDATANIMTPQQIGQSYKDYLSACRIVQARLASSLPCPRTELAGLMRVHEYVCNQREAYWKLLVKLPVEKFAEAFDNSKWAPVEQSKMIERRAL